MSEAEVLKACETWGGQVLLGEVERLLESRMPKMGSESEWVMDFNRTFARIFRHQDAPEEHALYMREMLLHVDKLITPDNKEGGEA